MTNLVHACVFPGRLLRSPYRSKRDRESPKREFREPRVFFGTQGTQKHLSLLFEYVKSNELQMKLCHMENITKFRVERKILVFFGSLLGIVSLGTKHTQETHTMNLSGEIGRKSGFSSESKKIFCGGETSLPHFWGGS